MEKGWALVWYFTKMKITGHVIILVVTSALFLETIYYGLHENLCTIGGGDVARGPENAWKWSVGDETENPNKPHMTSLWGHSNVTWWRHRADVIKFGPKPKIVNFSTKCAIEMVAHSSFKFLHFWKKTFRLYRRSENDDLSIFRTFLSFFPEYLGPTKKPPFATKTQKCDIFFQKS